MIQISPYTVEFETEYWNVVKSKIDRTVQQEIVDQSKFFLPDDFFDNNMDHFKQLTLASFSKLKNAHRYILDNKLDVMHNQCLDDEKRKEPYEILHNAFSHVVNSRKNKSSLRVRMVRATGLTVCPYCNRDYINCRDEDISGAQLDHFYSRKDFPIFSLCLYNLVPVCGNCNRIKSAKESEFVSPFDDDVEWEEAVAFSYELNSEPAGKVLIDASGSMKVNITELKIEEAYLIHDREVRDLLEKRMAYSESQRDEISRALGAVGISDEEIKRIVFGPRISLEDMKTKPLGKMIHDLHKELGVYD